MDLSDQLTVKRRETMSKMSKEKVKELIERIRSEQENIGAEFQRKHQWCDKLSASLKAEIEEIGWPREIVSLGADHIMIFAKACKQI